MEPRLTGNNGAFPLSVADENWPIGERRAPATREAAIERVASIERELDRLDRERRGAISEAAADDLIHYRGRLMDQWRAGQFKMRLNGRVTPRVSD